MAAMGQGRLFPAKATALLAAAVWAGGAWADAAGDEFVARVNAVLSKTEPGGAAGLRAACAALVDTAFDIGAIAPAVSAGTWPKLNGKQRAAYRAAVERRIARDCRSRSRDIAGKTMQAVGERSGDGGDRFIAVRDVNGGGRQLIWRVRAGAGRLRAVDVTVDGRSLAVTIEKDARALLQKAGGDLQQFVTLMGG